MRYSIAYSIVSFSAFLFTATASWATPLTSGGPGGVGTM